MKATSGTVYDGQLYQIGEEIPDLGSWQCVGMQGGKRTYWGLSEDVDKLPKYCVTGSKALCLDNGDVYLWHNSPKEWYKFSNSSSGGVSVLGVAALGALVLGQ